MGFILLAIVLVFAGLEAFLGVKRGIIYSGVRLLLLACGTLISALLAKVIAKMIITKIAASNGITGNSLSEISQNLLNSSGLDFMAGSLNVPLAALLLSAAIPFVFAVLFIIFKLITWGIYFGVSKFLDKTPVKDALSRYDLVSKIAGGVLGAFMGIASFAIIVSPVMGLIKTVDKTDAVQSVFNILNAAGSDAADKVAKSPAYELAVKLEKAAELGLGPVTVYAADSSEEDLLRKIYDSLASSPATYICRYVGAEGIAYAIYKGTSDVTPNDVGGTGVKTESYSFPETVSELMGVAAYVDDTLTIINSGDGLSPELIESAQAIVLYVIDSSIFADEDKLDIVNAASAKVSETISEMLGLGEQVEFLSKYADFEDFKSDVDSIFEVANALSGIDFSTDENGNMNVDVDSLMADTALLTDFVTNTMKISNGAEILAGVVNGKVAEMSDGRLERVVSVESISTSGTDAVIKSFTTMVDMLDPLTSDFVSLEDQQRLHDKAKEVRSYGVILPEAIDVLEDWLDE